MDRSRALRPVPGPAAGPDGEAARVKLLRRFRATHPDLARRIISTISDDVVTYQQLDPVTVTAATARVLDQLLAAMIDRRGLDVDETRFMRDYGRLRAQQGLSLDDVLSAWRLGVRLCIDELATLAARYDVSDRAVLAMARELLEVSDSAIAVFSSAHRDVALDRARLEQSRDDLVRGILLGTVEPDAARAQGARFGLVADRSYLVFRSRPAPGVLLDDLARRFAGQAGCLTVVIDNDVAGLGESVPDAGSDGSTGVAESTTLDDVGGAFAEATRALRTAEAFGITGVTELGDLGLLPAVLSDRALGDALVATYLAPVGEGQTAQAILQTLEVYLDCDQRVDLAAERLFVHANTVRYRLARYQALAQVDVNRLCIAAELWWALKHASITGAQHGARRGVV